MVKDTYYFSHDYNARTDPALRRLQMEMGHEGKGIFWDLVEILYENEGYLPEEYLDTIAFDLRIDLDTLKKVVYRKDLFKVKDGLIYSDSVLRRLGKRRSRSDHAKKAAEARWGGISKGEETSNADKKDEQCRSIDGAVPIDKTSTTHPEDEQCSSDADAMHEHEVSNALKERKGKESKEKENKGKESKGKERKKKEKESKASKKGGKSPPVTFFKELRACFADVYKQKTGVDYYFTAKDAGQLKLLHNKIWASLEKADVPIDERSMTGTLQIMMTKHENEWIDKNLSIAIINSKYNEIIAGIKRKRTTVTDSLKAEIYGRLSAGKGADP